MDAGIMNDSAVLEAPDTAAVLAGENRRVRPDLSTWNKDFLSPSNILQEDVRFDQHLWMYNTSDITWLTQGSYYEEHPQSS